MLVTDKGNLPVSENKKENIPLKHSFGKLKRQLLLLN